MTVSECVQAVLEADAPLIAQVPAERIRVPGAWQDLQKPFIEHMPVSIEPDHAHSGLTGGRKWVYQVSVFAGSVSAGEDISLLVVDALSGSHAVGSPVSDRIQVRWLAGVFYVGREAENEVEHFALQFQISKVEA